MGIQDLNTALKDKDPNIYKTVFVNKFKHKRISVDAFSWIYSNMAIAHKGVINRTDVTVQEPDRNESFKILIHMFLEWYLKWLCLEIQPVLVFDGKHSPYKIIAHTKRSKQKDGIKEKIQIMEAEIKSLDPLMKTKSHLDKLRALKSQLNWVSQEEISDFKNLVRLLGIPYYTAIGEAEKLCSSLTIEGITCSSLGKDTDFLPYGCPSIVKDLKLEGNSVNGPVYSITEILLSDVLKCMDLPFDLFIDFCIGLGCDYNNRVSGKGPKRVYDLVKKVGKIENFGFNIDCLNVEICRAEFKYVKSSELILEGHIDILPYENDVKEVLGKFGLEKYLDSVIKCHNNMPVGYNVESIKMAGKPILKIKSMNVCSSSSVSSSSSSIMSSSSSVNSVNSVNNVNNMNLNIKQKDKIEEDSKNSLNIINNQINNQATNQIVNQINNNIVSNDYISNSFSGDFSQLLNI